MTDVNVTAAGTVTTPAVKSSSSGSVTTAASSNVEDVTLVSSNKQNGNAQQYINISSHLSGAAGNNSSVSSLGTGSTSKDGVGGAVNTTNNSTTDNFKVDSSDGGGESGATLGNGGGDYTTTPLQQVATDQYPSYSLPFWDAAAAAAAVVSGGTPTAILPQANSAQVQNAAALFDMPPTSPPHWNNLSNSANAQTLIFQNISDPGQHSPYGIEHPYLNQSPLFTPANFYSPAPTQFGPPPAFTFPPVEWNTAATQAPVAASYIGGRNNPGANAAAAPPPNFAFFNNYPTIGQAHLGNPAATSVESNVASSSLLNGSVKNLSSGMAQMSLDPNRNGVMGTDYDRGVNRGAELNVALNDQYNASAEQKFISFSQQQLNDLHNSQRDQFEAMDANSKQQTYAGMLRSGHGNSFDHIHNSSRTMCFNNSVPDVGLGGAAGFNLHKEQLPNNDNLDIGTWESNTSAIYTHNRNSTRDSNVKHFNTVTSTSHSYNGNTPNNNPSHNRVEQQRNKPYSSSNHHNNQSSLGNNSNYSYENKSRSGSGPASRPHLNNSNSNNYYPQNSVSGGTATGAGLRPPTVATGGFNQQSSNHPQQQYNYRGPPNNHGYRHYNQQNSYSHSSYGNNANNPTGGHYNKNSNSIRMTSNEDQFVHYDGAGVVKAHRNTEDYQKLVEKLTNVHNFNPTNFDCDPKEARFFVIKSYSEDDIHRSIKYNVWCSTESGNQKLDTAFKSLRGLKGGPMYLFFSVNGSGHFCGLAEMITAVDYSTQAGVWQQDKWKGRFDVKWIFIKDVPNSKFRHLIIESNDKKPVTHSRDTQEVPYELGKQMLVILSSYPHQTSMLDSFTEYETRQNNKLSSSSNNSMPPTGSGARGGGTGGYHNNSNSGSHQARGANNNSNSHFNNRGGGSAGGVYSSRKMTGNNR